MFMRNTPPILDDVEELHLSFVRMQQEKEAWKNKYQTLEVSYSTELKEKDDLIEILESRKRIYFPLEFSPIPVTHFLILVDGKKSPTNMQKRTST